MRQWVINGRRVNGLIRRVQQVTTTIGASATVANATIKQVDLANSLIFNSGDTHTVTGTTSEEYLSTYVTFTSGTQVTATRGNPDGVTTVTNSITVVEFWPGVIRSIQSGLASGAAGTINQTIAAVSPQAFTFNTGWNIFNPNWTAMTLVITTPTNLQIVTLGASSVQEWFVVDFN